MAARRLIAVMLVLLFLSSLAAALAPVERPPEETSTTTQPQPDPAIAGGRLVRETVDADANKPPTIRAAVGDQLQLRVIGRLPTTIELARLGPTEDLDPLAPARFDVLLETKGRFPVRVLGGGRIATIAVSRRPAPRAPAPDRARARS